MNTIFVKCLVKQKIPCPDSCSRSQMVVVRWTWTGTQRGAGNDTEERAIGRFHAEETIVLLYVVIIIILLIIAAINIKETLEFFGQSVSKQNKHIRRALVR